MHDCIGWNPCQHPSSGNQVTNKDSIADFSAKTFYIPLIWPPSCCFCFADARPLARMTVPFYGFRPFIICYHLVKPCVFGLDAAQQKHFSTGGAGLCCGYSIHRPPAEPTDQEDITMLTGLVRFIQQWKRYNQSLNELSRLGDRELADIGISRSDIPRVAWNNAHRR